MTKFTKEQFKEAAQRTIDECGNRIRLSSYDITDSTFVVMIRSNSGKSEHGFRFCLEPDGTVSKGFGGYPGDSSSWILERSLIEHLNELA